MRAILERDGRVLIPKRVRDELHLRPGTPVALERCNGELHIRPLDRKLPLALKGGVLVFSGVATGDLSAAVGRHRTARLRRLARRLRR
jgi:AbrB family looped-hinge helix DNA binding protein